MRKLMNAILLIISSAVACSAPPALPGWWERECARLDRVEQGRVELECLLREVA